MAARTFVPFDEFDIASFVDYGRLHYDNNFMDKGKTFSTLRRLMARRESERARAAQRAEIERRKAARRQKRRAG